MDVTLPSQAILAFEQATGLTLCFHDFRRSLWPYTDASRNEHVNPVCRLVKTKRELDCRAFCARHLHREADKWVGGAVKRCHAGVIELYLPVFVANKLEWILYAGVRRPAENLVPAILDENPQGQSGPWIPTIKRLPAIDNQTAIWQLELLRQLAARLVAWRVTMQERLPEETHKGTIPIENARRSAINFFLSKQHRNSQIRLADLASHVQLSEDRASHLVGELFGTTFSTLLLRIRLETAQGLLRLSDLPLREVAKQSGFGSRAQFYFLFQREVHMTPLQWRQSTSA